MRSDRSRLSLAPDAGRHFAPHARPRTSNPRRFASIFCCALFIVALVGAVQGQSGRRVQKHEEIPPVPTPTPLPQASKPKQEAIKKMSILVLVDNAIGMQTSTTAQEIVMQSFGQRLREADAFVITAEATRATRGEAQRRAKNEQERFVVWVALRVNGMSSDPAGISRPNAEDYHIEYGVYEPVTGRTRTYGNVYLRAGYGSIGGVAVGVPRCYPAVFAYEYEFVVGAIDAANRVIKAFNVPLPPVCGG
ncbi:MAG: hypothetical protein QOF61_2644 [Acidobacteriota bacterium]|jgi:hypothetical protein|nr:hypothetical protein [Acidobacteriota bacterium]